MFIVIFNGGRESRKYTLQMLKIENTRCLLYKRLLKWSLPLNFSQDNPKGSAGLLFLVLSIFLASELRKMAVVAGKLLANQNTLTHTALNTRGKSRMMAKKRLMLFPPKRGKGICEKENKL